MPELFTGKYNQGLNIHSLKKGKNIMGTNKYFNQFMDIKELRDLYRSYCLKMHPDKGGDHNSFVEMQNEYEGVLKVISGNEKEKAFRENRDPHFTFEGEKAIMEMLSKVMRVPGIIIEICGSWIWISGNTFSVREILNGFGMRYSKPKKSWYFSAYMSKGKMRGRYSMKKIRNTFGSVRLQTKEEDKQRSITTTV